VEHDHDPISWAAEVPDRAAIIMGSSGVVTTYAQLADRVVRLVHLLRSYGLQPGDGVALVSENTDRFHEVVWACKLGGFYLTPPNSHLGAEEIAYVVRDCGAKVLVASGNLPVAAELTADLVPGIEHRLAQNAPIEGWDDYDVELAKQPTEVPETSIEGDLLQYSSGTTGRPKGIKRPLRDAPLPYAEDRMALFLKLIGGDEGTVYLSPAPLYHSAPIGWTMGVLRVGGTVVVMERFDAEDCLRLIQEHRVETGQFVPTMFVRLQKLPQEVRDRYDVSSLKGVIHAAAPCPVEVKRKMMDWWGPIIYEYWSSSEVAGFTFITPDEWLAHPGSVGRSLVGTLHIVGPDGEELPPGEAGQIWAEGSPEFSYLGDSAKDSETTDRHGWRSVGDIGRLDEEGYLYLTDRASFMIISGGVNVYPQEAENA